MVGTLRFIIRVDKCRRWCVLDGGRVGSFVLRWDGENRCHLRYVPWWSIRHEVVMIVAGGCV